MSPGPAAAGDAIDVGDVDLPSKPAKEVPIDLEVNRDKVRGWLALALVVLLIAVIVAAWATLWAGVVAEPEIKDLLGVILPPVVALVGSALGFYFGGRTLRAAQRDHPPSAEPVRFRLVYASHLAL